MDCDVSEEGRIVFFKQDSDWRVSRNDELRERVTDLFVSSQNKIRKVRVRTFDEKRKTKIKCKRNANSDITARCLQ